MNQRGYAVLRRLALAAGLLLAAALAPAQFVGGPAGPPPSFVQGPTLADTLRNGAQAASNQAQLTARTAAEMGRRARSPGYQTQNFEADFHNLQVQFQNLCGVFNQLAGFVSQLQSSQAANAAAELAAGLNIIAEAFVPVQQQSQTGTLNRQSVAAMCDVLNQALLEWQKELKKDGQRLRAAR